MIQKILKPASIRLGLIGGGLILLLAVLMLSSYTNRRFLDVWKQLGMTERDGASHVEESFLNGYLQTAGARNLKAIATGDRAGAATEMLAFTKNFVSGPEFKAAYDKERKRRIPRAPEKPRTEAEFREKSIADLKNGLTNLETGMKTATPENKKLMQSTYDMLQNQIKEYQDPENAMVKMVIESEQRQYNDRMEEHKAALKKWETAYPEDPKAFVKRRLQQVLDATKDIDYSAQLTERNGKKYFVKPEYEKKPGNWKYGFRAGKEVTETVRAFVQKWITEL